MKRYVLVAVLALTACSSGNPPRFSNAKPSLHVAQAALQSGAASTALQIARGILADHPDNADALIMQGQIQLQLNDVVSARNSFESALRERPTSSVALLGLGKAELPIDPRLAEDTFRRALSAGPQAPGMLTDLGVALDLQGKHEQAQASYRSALAQGDDQLATRVDLGLSLAISGHVQEGLNQLKPVGTSPDVSSRVRQDLAAALTISGDEKSAEAILGPEMTHEQIASAISGYQALR